jgi:hypothetical protein
VFALLTRVLRDYLDGYLTRPGAYVVKSLKTLEKEALDETGHLTF